MAGTTEEEPRMRIAGEQVRMVYTHLPASLPLPIVAAALIAYVLRDELPAAQLRNWVIWVALSYSLLPTSLYLLYRKAADQELNARRWGIRFALMACATAASWGSAGYFLFVPDSPIHQILLGGMLFTSAVAVMATTFSYTPGYYAGVIPILLPVAVSYLMEGGLLPYAMSGVIAMAFLMLGYFQRCMQRSLSRSLEMRFELERLNAKLETKNSEIEAISAEKQRIFAAASHDLRQPLHAQRLLLSELADGVDDPDRLRVMGCLRQSMDAMNALLDEFLEISRIDSGSVKPVHRVFRLQDLLDRLELTFSGLAREKGLGLRVVPCACGVNSDPVMIERVLGNLIQNAIQYTSQGSVMVACRRRGRMLDIQVRDSGHGISEQQHTLVFGEFTQLNNPERNRNKGVGLGLAIVARLLRMLGHDLALRSSPGKGSVFSLRVPVAELPGLDVPGRDPETLPGGGLDGLRVLVVEDDETILAVITRLLAKWGCSTYSASDARQAMRVLERETELPDIVMTDYRLPGEWNGLELLSRVRKAYGARMGGVIITGDVSPEIVRGAQEVAGVVMHKPVSDLALFALLSNMRPPIRQQPRELSA